MIFNVTCLISTKKIVVVSARLLMYDVIEYQSSARVCVRANKRKKKVLLSNKFTKGIITRQL
jgi:hypothetical protein